MIKKISTLALFSFLCFGRLAAQQTSRFNFTAAAVSVSGWSNVSGDPATAVRSATDAATGISITSISTANWAPLNGAAAYNGGGMTNGTFFPAAVMANHWFQYNASLASYNAAIPQLIISGLNKDSVYTVSMTGSWGDAYYEMNPTRYTVAGATVNGYIDLNLRYNTADGAVFNNVSPNTSGQIKVYVNTVATTNVAGISGLQIIRGATTIPTPVVSLTSPSNNVTLPEDANITISATASEAGGTISHVEFYRDTVKIGDVATAPYSMVWVASDHGTYTLKARAIDGSGHATTSTITVHVESLDDFWSTTGNISTNADSFFVGTVDSNRLALRTRNIERMSITPAGKIGIGTISPTVQLHTTDSVRFALYKNNTATDSILTTDTSGNLKLRLQKLIGGNIYNPFNVYYDDVVPYQGALDTVATSILTIGNHSASITGIKWDTLTDNTNVATIGTGPGGVSLVALENPGHGGLMGITSITGIGSSGGKGQISFAVTDSLGTGNKIQIFSNGIKFLTRGLKLVNFPNNTLSDSVLTTDTAGNLKLRSVASFGSANHWQTLGSTYYDSLDNIGIGTSNPQGYKLAVNGSAIFIKVRVKAAGNWPDYVFEKGYTLPGLPELERYLAEHKHLPDIVSAAEAQKDGIDVAAQQAALLKKVEELTLYLIEENKQLKAQVKKDAEQNVRIAQLQQQLVILEKLIKEKK